MASRVILESNRKAKIEALHSASSVWPVACGGYDCRICWRNVAGDRSVEVADYQTRDGMTPSSPGYVVHLACAVTATQEAYDLKIAALAGAPAPAISVAKVTRNEEIVWEGAVSHCVNYARNRVDEAMYKRGERPIDVTFTGWRAGNLYGNWVYSLIAEGASGERSHYLIWVYGEDDIRNCQSAARARQLDPESIAFPLPAPKLDPKSDPYAEAIRLANEAQAIGRMGINCPICNASIYASGIPAHWELFHGGAPAPAPAPVKAPRQDMCEHGGYPSFCGLCREADEAPARVIPCAVCGILRIAPAYDCDCTKAPDPTCPVCGINLPDHSDDCSLSAQERERENGRLVMRALVSDRCALCGADIAGAFHSPDDCASNQAPVSYRERSRQFPGNTYFRILALRETIGEHKAQAGSGIGSDYEEAIRIADEALARLANFY